MVGIAAVMVIPDHASQAQPPDRGAVALKRSVSALLASVPQEGNVLGSPSAPVTLQFFGDLECSTSRAFTLELLPSIIAKWVRTDELRIEYRSLRTATLSSKVFLAQQSAALAAGRQGKLWYYVEDFYHRQGREGSDYVTGAYLKELAQLVPGLNVWHWNSDRTEPSLAAEVASDEQSAVRRGLDRTPSLLISLTGREGAERRSRQYLVEPLALDSAIEAMLSGASHSSRTRESGRATAERLDTAFRAGATSSEGERVPC
jgi:protein-disulfide isomerase